MENIYTPSGAGKLQDHGLQFISRNTQFRSSDQRQSGEFNGIRLYKESFAAISMFN
jgi:hypothetical protein